MREYACGVHKSMLNVNFSSLFSTFLFETGSLTKRGICRIVYSAWVTFLLDLYVDR